MNAGPWTWKVQANAKNGLFGWVTKVDRLSWQYAMSAALKHAEDHPDWFVRITDDATGEVIHIEREAA